tara:strand:- start:273 stop:641 length:369 start_codon:yes stop_codon:yes gene_type:complete
MDGHPRERKKTEPPITLRGLANRQDMFDAYFQFYMPARQGTTISAQLIELVRLRIARHNVCFTRLNARLLQIAGHDLTEEKILQLDLDKSLSKFSEGEQLALEYAGLLAVLNLESKFCPIEI